MADARPEAVTAEVEGYDGPLEDAVEDGLVDPPTRPLSWPEWQHWRSRGGLRPHARGLGREAYRQNMRNEVALWKRFSESFFGEDWKNKVAASAPPPPPAPRREVPARPREAAEGARGAPSAPFFGPVK